MHGDIDMTIVKNVVRVYSPQTTWSVLWIQTIVMQMQTVQIPKEVSGVLVLQATVEMGSIVKVCM